MKAYSSFLVYHFESKKSAPGKNAASTKPRKNLVNRAPVKFVVMPVKQEITPQMIMAEGR